MDQITNEPERFELCWVGKRAAIEAVQAPCDKRLIPCYKGIEAYDMPREFKNLQAQDLGKLG